MDRLLAKLERRLGSLAIEGLPLIIVVGTGIAFVLSNFRPDITGAMALDLDAVRRGQVWRLVSYLFLPRSTSVIWLFFSLYFTWLIGSALEETWGAFKLNVYYLIGMLGTTAAAWVTGGALGNFYLNTSMMLAFATLLPDYELSIYFVIRVKVKWIGMLWAAYLVYEIGIGDWPERAAIIAATSNYIVFFGGHLLGLARGRRVLYRQAARRDSYRAPPPSTKSTPPGEATMGNRACAICGTKEADGADIRICSCAQCGGVPRTLCLEHAKAHATTARAQTTL